MTSVCRDRYGDWFPELRARHAALFARRRELRRASRPALWKQVVYPAFLGSRRLYPPWLEDALWPVRKALRAGTAKPPSPTSPP
jgi:hypothetical protein